MIKCRVGYKHTQEREKKVGSEEGTLGASWEAINTLGLMQYNKGMIQDHLIQPQLCVLSKRKVLSFILNVQRGTTSKPTV